MHRRPSKYLAPLLLLVSTQREALAGGFLDSAPEVTWGWVAGASLAIFVASMILASAEELTGISKSKPVVLAGGIIWALIAWSNIDQGLHLDVEAAARGSLVRYLELMLFLLVVMAYVNALGDRRVFAALRRYVRRQGYSLRTLFWLTGGLTFMLSPLLDNLSTALVMGAVVIAIGSRSPRFTALGCINVVVASNAGGSFSAVGDLTTFLLWQERIATPQGMLDFTAFFHLLLPALATWVVPAALMQFAVGTEHPEGPHDPIPVRRGGFTIVALFLATIATGVFFETVLALPPVVGMMTGLGYLQVFGYYLKKTHRPAAENGDGEEFGGPVALDSPRPFDIYRQVSAAEWNSLFFICGVFLSVGGLAYLGWVAALSEALYGAGDLFRGQIIVGLLSAFVENVPTMFSVLAMNPEMSLGHWLLVTLTVASGGSLLSIGSAAGVALAGQAPGVYTFLAHLRWSPVIALGYASGIAVHAFANSSLF